VLGVLVNNLALNRYALPTPKTPLGFGPIRSYSYSYSYSWNHYQTSYKKKFYSVNTF